jgi:hypothetical protein
MLRLEHLANRGQALRRGDDLRDLADHVNRLTRRRRGHGDEAPLRSHLDRVPLAEPLRRTVAKLLDVVRKLIGASQFPHAPVPFHPLDHLKGALPVLPARLVLAKEGLEVCVADGVLLATRVEFRRIAEVLRPGRDRGLDLDHPHAERLAIALEDLLVSVP